MAELVETFAASKPGIQALLIDLGIEADSQS